MIARCLDAGLDLESMMMPGGYLSHTETKPSARHNRNTTPMKADQLACYGNNEPQTHSPRFREVDRNLIYPRQHGGLFRWPDSAVW